MNQIFYKNTCTKEVCTCIFLYKFDFHVSFMNRYGVSFSEEQSDIVESPDSGDILLSGFYIYNM